MEKVFANYHGKRCMINKHVLAIKPISRNHTSDLTEFKTIYQYFLKVWRSAKRSRKESMNWGE